MMLCKKTLGYSLTCCRAGSADIQDASNLIELGLLTPEEVLQLPGQGAQLADDGVLVDAGGHAPHPHAALDEGVYLNLGAISDEQLEECVGIPDIQPQHRELSPEPGILHVLLELLAADCAGVVLVHVVSELP